MVRLESISKSFGSKKVIADFSLEVGAGEIFILLGRSGCGKTTLLRLIAGFEPPDNGRIFIAGEDVTTLPVEKRPVGFIFQNHALFPHMTVYDNIAVGPRIRKMPEKEIARRIAELLEVTRLSNFAHAFPSQLSGGESQRIALARAIVNRPKILLLDEPLSALDPNLRQNMRAELVEIQKTFGTTFLFVTHDQEEAMSLAMQMGILENGRLRQTGTPAQLYDHPNCSFVAQFLGDINRLTDQQGTRFIRPEKMFISKPYLEKVPSGSDSMSRLEGVVTNRSFFGNHTVYQVETKNRNTVCVRVPRNHQNTEPHLEGDSVWILFHPHETHVFAGEQE